MNDARVAAIDCGTNSIRLLVADPPTKPGGELVDLTRRMEIVRLGQGVDRTGRLAPEAIERTRVALADYAAQIEEFGAGRVRMVATSATRDAVNAADFRDMVRATLGVDPEVITGAQEARLSFTGAVRGLPTGRYLVVDIGGGSTEFVLGESTVDTVAAGAGGGVAGRGGAGAGGPGAAGGGPAAISVDIGCVRMTERHLRDDPPSADQIAAATVDIEAAIDKALSVVGEPAGATLVGVAGTVTTVAGIALGLPAYDPERIHHAHVSTVDVRRVTGELLAMTHDERLALPVMHPGRADVIGAGTLILKLILDRAGVPELVASEHDILDGIAYSLIGD
jgi:exopolyphosphatase/guanosine-5'-triphosphate,3'-diphosphate pyrophosphatase